ncbi:MAG TPA: ribonuclease E/G, partial [Pseudolabrys sp.]|nr:ribonuclease E/G [Pseudolabrys sp.]
MADKMLIDATHPEETRVVVVRGNRVEEFDFESANRKQLRGNIYLAKVTRVEPSLQAAFVDYGGNRHGFLAFSEIHPDYYQIPVADRQALIEQEERDQRAAENEEEQQQRRGRRGGRHRRRGAERHRGRDRDAVQQSEPLPPEELNAEAGEMPAAELPATEGTTSEAAPLALAESIEPVPSTEAAPEAPVAETASEPAPAPTVEAQAVPVEDVAIAPEGGDDHAETGDIMAEAAEIEAEALPLAAEAAPEEQRQAAPSEGDDDADETEENGEDHEEHEEEVVESVGGADALEEVQERVPRFRRQYKIQEVIKRRQVMLVQVVKEERGTKGAALTTYLSLAGRYSVLMPNTARGGGISRKITSSEDRARLKEIAQDLEVPEGM